MGRVFDKLALRAKVEADRQANIDLYYRYVRALTLAQADRDRRPLRKAWNR